jgi:very-short-patch-repair endonuclease
MQGFERCIAPIAARQDNVVHRTQLLEAGMGRGALAYRLQSGGWQRLAPCVYLLSFAAPTRRQRIWGAALFGGPDGAISHRTAAEERRWLPVEDETIHILVGPRSCRTPPGLCVHRSTTLEPHDIVAIDGIRMTCAVRTLLDLAASEPTDVVEAALTEAQVHDGFDDGELRTTLACHTMRPGAARLRAILTAEDEYGYTRARSERILRALLKPSGLPMPLFNQRVGTARPDCTWRREHLIVQVDGYGTHRDRAAFEADRLSDQILVADGWRVIRMTWRQLRNEPLAVLARIAQALAVGVC